MSVSGHTNMRGLAATDLSPGELVEVAYWHGHILAKVIEVEPEGRYGPMRGWVMVEQITDYENAEARPRFEAAIEFMERASGDHI